MVDSDVNGQAVSRSSGLQPSTSSSLNTNDEEKDEKEVGLVEENVDSTSRCCACKFHSLKMFVFLICLLSVFTNMISGK